MPRAGLTMVEGTIQSWLVSEGDFVEKGTPIMEFENEKNIVTCDALGTGYIHILAQEGDTVQVGAAIGLLLESKDEICNSANVGTAMAAEPVPPNKSSVSEEKLSLDRKEMAAQGLNGRVRATGLARKMAAEAGINLAAVTPSGGPDGRRIVANDIKAYLTQKSEINVTPVNREDSVTEIRLTGLQKTVAKNMLDSTTHMAQCSGFCECDATELLALREKLVGHQEMLGCKVTLNDLLCKMMAKILTKYPRANGTFDGETIHSHEHVHLSVAVGAEDGLRVPVVKNADLMSIAEISLKIKDLATRAKNKTLKPDEQSGGTFTVTNFGIYPIDFATSIVNPPQIAICGFGRVTRKPVVMEDDSIQIRSMINVILTYDHRVLDGLQAGLIFRDIQYYIEHPEMILA